MMKHIFDSINFAFSLLQFIKNIGDLNWRHTEYTTACSRKAIE